MRAVVADDQPSVRSALRLLLERQFCAGVVETAEAGLVVRRWQLAPMPSSARETRRSS